MRGFALAESGLLTFDRQFQARCRIQQPDRYRLLDALPRDVPRIARGGGVSYVAASFGDGVVSQQLGAFNRFLAFDADSGHLAVEAGACVGDVQRFALARGWYLAVSPGHPRASVGGCIAADVHGKNPARDGTFRRQVQTLEILRADGEIIVADAQRNSDLLAATCAGFGLSGTIVRVVLRLARAPASLVLRRVPVRDFVDAARVLREAANAPVLYGWHDGRAAHFGRGVIRIGLVSDALEADTGTAPPASRDLPAAPKPLPVALWSRAGISAANTWLGWRWCRAGQSPFALADALFPLNDARTYFAGYGKAGFVEAQWLIPHIRFEGFAEALADIVGRHRPRIALIASKLFDGTPEGFGFDGRGIALALQVPDPSATAQRDFLQRLADVAVAHGGRPNLIKESFLDAQTARAGIAGFEAARMRLARFNPGGLHRSELARRLVL